MDGTAFPLWRVIAYQSMLGYRPPNTLHAYNAQPCIKFLYSQLLAWPRRLSPDMLCIQVPD
jgi:hypothetical protein